MITLSWELLESSNISNFVFTYIYLSANLMFS